MTDYSNRIDGRAEQPDTIAAFLGSLIAMWGRGLSAWETIARGGCSLNDPSQNGAMLGAMAEMAKSFDAMFRGGFDPGATGETGQAATSQVADMSSAMARAYGIAVASMVRYGRVLAEIHMRHQASLMRATAGRAAGQAAVSPAECRALADEMRAFLREVGDAASQEARCLQQELETIGESIARAADEATPSAYPHERRRRHEVKQ